MVGELLREIREQKGLTQQLVSERAEISRSYLSEVERGRYSPTLEVFLRICEGLETSASELVRRLVTARK